jgi:hypothetical protein
VGDGRPPKIEYDGYQLHGRIDGRINVSSLDVVGAAPPRADGTWIR